MATAKHTRARRAHSPTLPSKPRRKLAIQPFPSDTTVGSGVAIGEVRRAPRDPAPRDRSPTGALRQIRARLEVAKSAAYVSSVALRAQAADGDTDVALVLHRIVADEIGRQVERIDLLLGGVAP